MSRGPTPARVLGRYALFDKIASGGMASVHLGRLLGAEGFSRTVAIKRLHAQFAENPDFVRMFVDEARTVSRIRHPNVVPTLDVVSEGDELFLVLEYVHGESLSRLLRAARDEQRTVSPAIAATIVAGVLSGLHAAHEAKSARGEPLDVVHRDVSPQNILVGADGVARVLDFGVAKSAERLQTTREGQLKGKLSYMAPEQIRGTVTRASDLYAASIVLWEALAGQRLFEGKTEAHTFDKVLRGCQTPPSAVAPDVPKALDDVVMRGLRVDPAERYASARDMARALEDAGAVVPSSKIGEWVESLAHEALAERQAHIAAIEHADMEAAPPTIPSARGEAEVPVVEDWTSPLPRVDRAEATSVPVTDEAVHTQLSTGSVSSPGQAAPAARRRTTPWVALGVAAVAASGATVAFWPAPSSPAPTAAQASAPSTSAMPPPEASAVPSAQAAETTPAVVDSSTAAAPIAPPAAPSARSSAPVHAAPATGPVHRASAPSSSDGGAKAHCNPPWYELDGVRYFKKDCL